MTPVGQRHNLLLGQDHTDRADRRTNPEKLILCIGQDGQDGQDAAEPSGQSYASDKWIEASENGFQQKSWTIG